MKKTYETPVAEKIEFCYEDQIVASGNNGGNNGGHVNNLFFGCPLSEIMEGWGSSFCAIIPFSE